MIANVLSTSSIERRPWHRWGTLSNGSVRQNNKRLWMSLPTSFQHLGRPWLCITLDCMDQPSRRLIFNPSSCLLSIPIWFKRVVRRASGLFVVTRRIHWKRNRVGAHRAGMLWGLLSRDLVNGCSVSKYMSSLISYEIDLQMCSTFLKYKYGVHCREKIK